MSRTSAGPVSRFPTALLLLALASTTAPAADKPRARALGVPLDGTPGPLNAITDVAGVEVGHTTLIAGEGKLKVGTGPVRTGVTAVLPRGRASADPVFAGWFSLNGNGEMTGTAWIEESGFLEGPVLVTNTSSVGTVRDAVVKWCNRQGHAQQPWVLPVVAETYDGYLNDTHGFHVKEEHVFAALDSARAGAVAEGNVGGGTGMTCFEFKGGIGTASRKLGDKQGGHTVGVLVQANFGRRPQLLVAGVPVGREITDGAFRTKESGSIIIVVATDAPLLPHQLKRLARRAALGLARTGSVAGNGSGDLFLAFSTANPLTLPSPPEDGGEGRVRGAAKPAGTTQLTMLPNERMDPLFEATVQATEEAILNALTAAETMTGRDGHTVVALPHDRLRLVLKKYNRLAAPLTLPSPPRGEGRVRGPLAGEQEGVAVSPKEVTPLFNGKDLTGLYTWLKDTKHEDPRRVFRVTDGLLHITGDGFGYLATEKAYRDYHLVVEYRWGQRTDGRKYVRNSGVLVHAAGPDGGAGGTWMSSIECQLAQGCVGDLIVIRGKDAKGEAVPVRLSAETELSPDEKRHRWKKGGAAKTFPPTRGQLWWAKHDWDFKELLDTRGKEDVESPVAEWTRVECLCDGKHIRVLVNGTTVNECYDVFPASGKILLQSEGFELVVRKVELHPLKE